ncbi:MAG TPA: lysylphosphatidylglycerol synthase transmembrane domain-containing protein [Candidatus Saccharibacteria bacterium]|nr:lysylphosphatidylglycerol synthase transmembrane domain-containing protein [Candidatus Saccharibacteria bacterium]HRQ06878.1 lysylphosphatidylglycerol synthase transmembrane domain-containing protein [Candidatus Saccharibacteria bacterium]HRQ97715.1 lysylphosphatidylglycerol synthase transmembrane domain-containing protein [Candidatus Saccharibacteria bacterium]
MSFRLSFRTWVTIITTALLVLVIVFAWPEIHKAYNLLGSVNLWILSLLIPVQLISYFATGGMIFSYLRSKGNLRDTTRWQMTRMALELNFVNHIIPSGGAAGFSYLGWVLGRHGVSPGRATMSQIVRFVLTFISFILIMLIAFAALTLDHKVDRPIVLICSALVLMMVVAMFLFVFLAGNRARLVRFSAWFTKTSNKFITKITRGKKTNVVKLAAIENFFLEMHEDYIEIRKDSKILRMPFVWSIMNIVMDVLLVWLAFWSLGYMVNPAIIFIAYGVSSVASVLSVMPGGAGVYEAIMIAFLASAGVPPGMAIAGTLLARVVLVLGTILFGYVFYQLTIMKYGKAPVSKSDI